MIVSSLRGTAVRSIQLIQRSLPTAAFLAVTLFASLAQASTIVYYGSFTLKLYTQGESIGGYQSNKNWTADEIADTEASLDAWDAGILNAPGRNIKIDLVWTDLPGSALGGSTSATTISSGTLYNAAERVWKEGWTGSAGSYDTLILYDSGYSWNVGAGNPSSSQYDLRSVITHEIGHSLGFDTSYNSSTDKFGSALTTWDQHLVDSGNNRPAAGSQGTPGNFNQTDNPVFFDGTYSKAANGGSTVAIYAPSTFKEGSSLVHLNESTFPNALMSPQIGRGQVVRAPTDLEWAMMKDMGWEIVPEPGTLVMLLGAFGALILWRKRTSR